MISAFVLQHLHTLLGGEEDTKLIGVYSSYAAASAAIIRLRNKPGFRNFPEVVNENSRDQDGFHIGEFQIDQDQWPEGYETV
jgi:hypothetical protein